MSAPRDVAVRASLDPTKYQAGAEQVSWATKQMLRQQEQADRKWRSLQAAHQAALDENAARERKSAEAAAAAERKKQDALKATGRVMTATGAAILTGLAASTKAAVSWESAWTGVLKTVDGTPEQLDAVEKGLRDLTRVLPASHEEIAGVAEAAGQLGIQTDNVVAFTRTMIDLGESTNMSAADAATTLARFANVMGTSQSEISNLGAAIVGLGNNFATTESDIANMAMRIAGAARQAGMSEGQVLGLAAALSSVGIEAEAGGTAISTVMTKIGMQVDTNGPKLEIFARTAGMTSEQFVKAWRDDAGSALTAFITGLANTSAQGMTLNEVLTELGIKGIREADALRRLSSAHELLNDALAMGSTEYERNTALIEEANKRYATAEAKVQIAKNALNDAAIDIGATLLPALAGAAEGVADLLQWFTDLPGPVKAAVTILGTLVGVAATVGGGFLLLSPKIKAARENLAILTQSCPRAGAALRGLGTAAGVVGAALAALQIGGMVADWMAGDTKGIEATTAALLEMGDAGTAALDSLFKVDGWRNAFTDVDNLRDAIERIVSPGVMDRLNDFAGSVMFQGGSGELNRTREQFEQIGEALGFLVSQGHAERAAEQYEYLAEQWTSAGGAAEDLDALLPGYTEALTAAANQQALAGESGQEAADGIDEMGAAAEAAAEAQAQLTEAQAKWLAETADVFNAFTSAGGPYQAVIDKNREWAEAEAASKKKANDSWEDYYDGFSVSAEEYIAEMQRQVEAQEHWAQNVTELTGRLAGTMPADMQRAVDAMMDELIKLGPDGAAQIQLLHDMSDEELRQVVELYQRQGLAAGHDWADGVESARAPEVEVETAEAEAQIERVGSLVLQLPDGDVTVHADTSEATRKLNELNRQIAAATGGTRRLMAPDQMAAGGAVTGGIPGRDSVPILAMPGEHMLTVEDVRALGGQAGVYALRAALHGGVQRMAAGGAVNLKGKSPAYWQERLRSPLELAQIKQRIWELARNLEEREDNGQYAYRGFRREIVQRQLKDAQRERDDAVYANRIGASALAAAAKKEADAKLAAERAASRKETGSALSLAASRGNLAGSASSGLSGAQSLVDRLLSASEDEALSGKNRTSLTKAAASAEKSYSKLYGTLTHVTDQLDAAKEKAAELQAISDQTANALSRFDLSGAVEATTSTTATTNRWGETWSTTSTTGGGKAGILAAASQHAAKVKSLAGKIAKLVAKGFRPEIVSEVGAAGVEGGTVMADALLSMSAAEVKRLNGDYAAISTYAAQAGQSVTTAYSKGGLSGAQSQVGKLTAQQQQVQSQITGLSKQLENLVLGAYGVPARALGGPVWPGQPFLVGEKGPELFTPQQSGYVLPADATRRLASVGAGASAVQVDAVATISPQSMVEFARIVAPVVAEQIRIGAAAGIAGYEQAQDRESLYVGSL